MSSSPVRITHDDVNKAFKSGEWFDQSDNQLLEYLRVLCNEVIQSDGVRLLANNRCVSINAVLMRRFLRRQLNLTTVLTCVVIVLALFTLFRTG
jgi:hypothetical protein